MKTILELSPKGDTLWEIPDEIYPVIEGNLKYTRVPRRAFGPRRPISVQQAIDMLPEEWTKGIKSEPSARLTVPKGVPRYDASTPSSPR
jgi:hypothetical protein